ncbi:MAG: lysophospholipid acyltransferase family protein, partial [Puniceicoccales bacterium]|nr:lysophospholipid acyltransferase family protein [Puniceicoccales bacterium]
MITRLLIGSIAHCIAILPEWCVAFLCQILGRFFFLFFRRRRRIILSNLAHTFPEKTETECKIMARISCVRMVELGVLAIVLPYFSEKRIRRSFSLDSSVEEFFREREQNDGPCIVLLPHFSQMEAMTVIPLLNGAAKGYEIGVIYRPFKNKGLEQWIHKTRERFGLKLLSRKNGFSQAKEILRRRGIVVILFDQNAGEAGILSTFLGRVASTTFLPDLLFRHFHCPVYMFMPQRLGFFRGKCFCERLDLAVAGQDHPGEKDTAKKNDYCVTHAMNTWLERKLLFDYDVCCDWLWA